MIPGTVSYYPAQRRGEFPSVRTALASIGCTIAQTEAAIAAARANGSAAIGVRVALASRPDGRFAALIQRMPGGAVGLWLGYLELADVDRAVAEDAARQLAEASGTEWGIFEWVRRLGVVQ